MLGHENQGNAGVQTDDRKITEVVKGSVGETTALKGKGFGVL